MSEELKKAFEDRWGDAIATSHIKALAWEYFQCGWNRRQEAKPERWCKEHAITCANNPEICDDCNPMAWAYERRQEARIAELEAQVRDLQSGIVGHCPYCGCGLFSDGTNGGHSVADCQIAKLQSQRDRLRQALGFYGHHKARCACINNAKAACTCGLIREIEEGGLNEQRIEAAR